jgi:hypothetical protein
LVAVREVVEKTGGDGETRELTTVKLRVVVEEV